MHAMPHREDEVYARSRLGVLQSLQAQVIKLFLRIPSARSQTGHKVSVILTPANESSVSSLQLRLMVRIVLFYLLGRKNKRIANRCNNTNYADSGPKLNG